MISTPIAHELLERHPFEERANFIDACEDVVETALDASRGLLERIDGVGEQLRSDARLHGIALNQVHARMQNVLEEVLDADEIINAQMPRLVEDNEDIDIAWLSGPAARQGTKNPCV